MVLAWILIVSFARFVICFLLICYNRFRTICIYCSSYDSYYCLFRSSCTFDKNIWYFISYCIYILLLFLLYLVGLRTCFLFLLYLFFNTLFSLIIYPFMFFWYVGMFFFLVLCWLPVVQLYNWERQVYPRIVCLDVQVNLCNKFLRLNSG